MIEALAVAAVIVIVALAWDNRRFAHVWRDEEDPKEERRSFFRAPKRRKGG